MQCICLNSVATGYAIINVASIITEPAEVMYSIWGQIAKT